MNTSKAQKKNRLQKQNFKKVQNKAKVWHCKIKYYMLLTNGLLTLNMVL